MGRFAKPIFIKDAHGSTHRPKEPAPVTVLRQVPKAPGYFTPDNREIWRVVCTALLEMNALTIQTLVTVECHVNSIALMREAMQNRSMKLSTKLGAIDKARKSADVLGLSLASHSKVKVPRAKADTKTGGALQELVS